MDKKLVFVISLLIIITGCTEKEQPNSLNTTASATQAFISRAPTQATTISVVASQPAKISPLESAQKEYLASYDQYVRLLRESGPQTLDTLQALADYQKKYQIYQMLLKAEKADVFKKP